MTLGFDHELSADGFLDGWQLQGYVQAGRTEQRGDHIRGIRIDRVAAAGIAPTLWWWRRVPLWRWIAAGVAAGVPVGWIVLLAAAAF
ncbi:MAG: DUF2537 domain-containing protein [Rhodococcus ruber]|nr:DUF2537 domain-containing protein [Rhodococcus ruber]